uniref:Uncharacterized protein n=1 Tax=Romanomermis culicivorax TaxID=13658 RepID=A0A915IK84_ROMCU
MFHCIGQMWHRDRHNKIQHCRRVLDNSPTCLTMLVPEYKGHLQATFIDLNSRKTAISSFYYIRPLNSRWNSCPDSQLNYTVDKLPYHDSVFVYRKRPIIATVGSYFKDLVGYFQQSHLVQHSYSQPECSDMLASDSQPTIEEDKLYDFHRLLIDEDGLAVLELTNDIVFNDYIQPLSLAKYDIAELQTKPLFTVIYDAAWQHKPQAIIPLHIQSIVPPMNGDRWMMTRRSFQRVNGKDENLNTPLITCDKVAKKCELLGWHKNDGYYFTFGSHLDWMGQCLREAIKISRKYRLAERDAGLNQLCAHMDGLSIETVTLKRNMLKIAKNDPANIPIEYRLTLTGREAHARDPQDPNANQRLLLLNQNSLLIFASDIDLQVLHQSEYWVAEGTFEMRPTMCALLSLAEKTGTSKELFAVTVCYRTKVVKHRRFSLMQYRTKL